jgi:hypothetical protein
MAKYEEYKSNPTTANFLKLGKQAFEQPPVIVKSFAASSDMPVEPQEVQSTDAEPYPKRERRERRAARRARKLAKQIVIQRRRERAAKAMAELDALNQSDCQPEQLLP